MKSWEPLSAGAVADCQSCWFQARGSMCHEEAYRHSENTGHTVRISTFLTAPLRRHGS